MVYVPHDLTHFPTSPTNVTYSWRWRLCGVNRALPAVPPHFGAVYLPISLTLITPKFINLFLISCGTSPVLVTHLDLTTQAMLSQGYKSKEWWREAAGKAECIVTSLGAGPPRNLSSIPGNIRFFFIHYIRIGFDAHQRYCSVDMKGLFPRR
jgi:hypothetical protein